jgi:hypothetical protein
MQPVQERKHGGGLERKEEPAPRALAKQAYRVGEQVKVPGQILRRKHKMRVARAD